MASLNGLHGISCSFDFEMFWQKMYHLAHNFFSSLCLYCLFIFCKGQLCYFRSNSRYSSVFFVTALVSFCMRENNYTEHLSQAAGVAFQLTAAPARPGPLPGAAVPTGAAVPACGARLQCQPGCGARVAVPACGADAGVLGGRSQRLVPPLPFRELQMATMPVNAKCLG